MALLIKFLFFQSMLILRCSTIWPPPYDINLKQEEVFEISDNIPEEEFKDVYDEEDEMIKKELVKREDTDKDHSKYYRLHQLTSRRNWQNKQTITEHPTKQLSLEETNHDLEEPVPWEARYIDNKGNIIKSENENVFYTNVKKSKLMGKRSDKEAVTIVESYDYEKFEKEYEYNVKKELTSNNTLNFTNVNEDESLPDAASELVDFKPPKNCTKEESKGIGISAIECLWIDINKPKIKNKKYFFVERITRIIIIWFVVYLVIAIPLWCQKGWCCCCFRCKFCKPRERIDEVKQFYAKYPPGKLKISEDEFLEYTPTDYEIYCQKKLEHALMKL